MTLLAITSSVRKAEIFRLLFGLEAHEFHLRDLARRCHLATRTVQAELAQLDKVGLVTSRRDGNRRYYRANRENPIYGDLRSIVIKTTGLTNLLSKALHHPRVEFAFVFGSLASGEASPGSDVDLMVVGELGLRELTRLLAGVGDQVGREVNPHVMTRQEFVNRILTKDHFVSAILKAPRLFITGNENEFAELGK